MNSHHPDPLTPEERELASRLDRLGPHDGPPPELDARILAAARTASASTSRRPRERSHRWPAMLGVAATLVLAVGLSWQLRPRPDTIPARSEVSADRAGVESADSSTRASPSDSGNAAKTAAMMSEPAPAEVSSVVEESTQTTAPRGIEVEQQPAPASRPVTAPASAPTPDAQSNTAGSRPALREQEQQDADDESQWRQRTAEQEVDAMRQKRRSDSRSVSKPSPTAFPATAPPPAPPAPAPVRPAPAQAREVQEMAERQAPDHPTATAPGSGQSAMDDAADTESKSFGVMSDSSIDIRDIPVTDDARLPPADWIERIRQRRDAGRLDEARASLRRLLATWPDTSIPDDLRALAGPAGG